jgi:CMP-N,N'-diacetyllegionaminic acid synthase
MMNRTKKIKVIAIIPARGGSKGVLRKNVKQLAGKPLIVHTIEAALQSGVIDRVIVSTEDSEIAATAREYGAEIINRPAALAADEAPTEPALLHVVKYLEEIENYKADIIILLQATSPMRKGIHIKEALNQFLENGCDSLLSVCPSHTFLWKMNKDGANSINYDFRNRPRRQDAEPHYRENGAIYITTYKVLFEENNRLGGKIGLYEMKEEESLEIDSTFDFWLCEQLLLNKDGEYGGAI